MHVRVLCQVPQGGDILPDWSNVCQVNKSFKRQCRAKIVVESYV